MLIDLVPDLSKLLQYFFLCSLKGRRIFKGPMEAAGDVGQIRRAFLLCIGAKGDQIAEAGLAHIFVEVLGVMPRQIDANLFHHSPGIGVYSLGFQSRAIDLKSLPRILPEQCLRHLAASGIATTQEKDFDLLHDESPSSQASIFPPSYFQVG